MEGGDCTSKSGKLSDVKEDCSDYISKLFYPINSKNDSPTGLFYFKNIIVTWKY